MAAQMVLYCKIQCVIIHLLHNCIFLMLDQCRGCLCSLAAAAARAIIAVRASAYWFHSSSACCKYQWRGTMGCSCTHSCQSCSNSSSCHSWAHLEGSDFNGWERSRLYAAATAVAVGLECSSNMEFMSRSCRMPCTNCWCLRHHVC